MADWKCETTWSIESRRSIERRVRIALWLAPAGLQRDQYEKGCGAWRHWIMQTGSCRQRFSFHWLFRHYFVYLLRFMYNVSQIGIYQTQTSIFCSIRRIWTPISRNWWRYLHISWEALTIVATEEWRCLWRVHSRTHHGKTLYTIPSSCMLLFLSFIPSRKPEWKLRLKPSPTLWTSPKQRSSSSPSRNSNTTND